MALVVKLLLGSVLDLAPRDLAGTCLPTPSPILSLRSPIFPYMVKAVPRGGDKGRSPAASLPQLPELSQVAAAFLSQVRQPCGDTQGPWVVREGRGRRGSPASVRQCGASRSTRELRHGVQAGHSGVREEPGACGFLGLQGKDCAGCTPGPCLSPASPPHQVSTILTALN